MLLGEQKPPLIRGLRRLKLTFSLDGLLPQGQRRQTLLQYCSTPLAIHTSKPRYRFQTMSASNLNECVKSYSRLSNPD